MDVLFFETPQEFGEWLSQNHTVQTEQWVGFYKKASGRASMTWPESVDEALCYGWIDGLRKSIDDISYKIRFTPRKETSFWSAVNIKKVNALIEAGRMQPAGLAAWEKRSDKNSERYSYEQNDIPFDESLLAQIKKSANAWAFFESLPPSAKKPSIWWIMSAKKEETRERRLKLLIECCENGERIPMLRRKKK